jgi:hypothetical protein
VQQLVQRGQLAQEGTRQGLLPQDACNTAGARKRQQQQNTQGRRFNQWKQMVQHSELDNGCSRRMPVVQQQVERDSSSSTHTQQEMKYVAAAGSVLGA